MNKLQWKQYWREQRLNKKEEWKPVYGFEGVYEISNLGRVKSLRFGKEKVIKFGIRSGYLSFGAHKCGKQINVRIHRIVSETFIPNPENKPQVNHINGIKSDNRVENLEWCTISENIQHSYDVLGNKGAWLGKLGKLHTRSKSVSQFDKEGNFIKVFGSTREAERETGTHHINISYVCNGKYKSAGGFIWKYTF